MRGDIVGGLRSEVFEFVLLCRGAPDLCEGVSETADEVAGVIEPNWGKSLCTSDEGASFPPLATGAGSEEATISSCTGVGTLPAKLPKVTEDGVDDPGLGLGGIWIAPFCVHAA